MNAIVSVASLFLSAAAIAQAVDLFNGKDLAGWVDVNTSASTWTVAKDETGAPIIRCTGIPTGILRTEKAYENFVLELDWKHLSYPGNAGLFVWSDPFCAKGVPFSRVIERLVPADSGPIPQAIDRRLLQDASAALDAARSTAR